MTWTEESKREFDRIMAEERDWMRSEYHAVEMRDYRDADYCHEMRWRCMDAALKALKPVAEGASC